MRVVENQNGGFIRENRAQGYQWLSDKQSFFGISSAIFSGVLVYSNRNFLRNFLINVSPNLGVAVGCSLLACVVLKKNWGQRRFGPPPEPHNAAPSREISASLRPPETYALKWIQNNFEIYAFYTNDQWRYSK